MILSTDATKLLGPSHCPFLMFTTGKTLAERELEEKCRDHIVEYFDNLTAEEKENRHSLETIHGKVCESLDGKGWRKPSQLEIRQIVHDVAEKSDNIEHMGNDQFIWLG